MKGQLNSFFEFNVELELIEVDGDGMRIGVFRHFFTPQNLIENTGVFVWTGSNLKNVTVRTVTNHIICLKWRQSQNATSQSLTLQDDIMLDSYSVVFILRIDQARNLPFPVFKGGIFRVSLCKREIERDFSKCILIEAD